MKDKLMQKVYDERVYRPPHKWSNEVVVTEEEMKALLYEIKRYCGDSFDFAEMTFCGCKVIIKG